MTEQEITDPKLIEQLEKAQQSGDEPIMQALIDGRMSFPQDSRALNKPYWQGLMAKVSAKDPTFDTIDYKARARTRQAFTSGKEAANVTSFNTVLHHIGTLQDAADQLGDLGGLGTPLNSPGNYLSETFGSDKVTNFRTARKAVADEAVRAFRGVGGTGHDVQAVLENLSENASPEQIQGSLRTLANLLQGRIKSLGEQYSAGMGKTSDGINLLDDEAKQVLARISPDMVAKKDDDGTPGGPGSTSPDGGKPGPLDPTGQIDIGFANQSAADANGRPEQSDAYVKEMNAGIVGGSITTPEGVWAVQDKYKLTHTPRSVWTRSSSS